MGIAEGHLLETGMGLPSRRRRRVPVCPEAVPEAGSWGAERQSGGMVAVAGDLDIVSTRLVKRSTGRAYRQLALGHRTPGDPEGVVLGLGNRHRPSCSPGLEALGAWRIGGSYAEADGPWMIRGGPRSPFEL